MGSAHKCCKGKNHCHESAVDISVVIPVFLGEDSLEELLSRLNSVLVPLVPRFEIILVNDGSPDGSWDVIKKLVGDQGGKVKGINFSRRFGQDRAISAGLDMASGNHVVIMSCDFQDKPEDIPRLLKKAGSTLLSLT